MHRHMIFFFTILNRNHISFHLFSIYFQISNAFYHIVRVLHIEVVSGTAEAAGLRVKSPNLPEHGSMESPS